MFVEKTFNFLMFFLPLLLLLWIFTRRMRRKFFRFSALFLAVLLLIPFLMHGRKIDKTPWRDIASAMKRRISRYSPPSPTDRLKR